MPGNERPPIACAPSLVAFFALQLRLRAEADPAHALRGALAAPIVKHFAAITDPIRLGELLRAIDGYSGEPATMIALKLTPHVFQRPGEVRSMRWAELDLENAINGALRRLGFTGSEMTAHGFRTTASSLLYESGKWNPDAIARTVAQRHECCSWNL